MKNLKTEIIERFNETDPYEMFFGAIGLIFLALLLGAIGLFMYGHPEAPMSPVATAMTMPFLMMFVIGAMAGYSGQSVSAKDVFWGGILFFVGSHAAGLIGFMLILLGKAVL